MIWKCFHLQIRRLNGVCVTLCEGAAEESWVEGDDVSHVDSAVVGGVVGAGGAAHGGSGLAVALGEKVEAVGRFVVVDVAGV